MPPARPRTVGRRPLSTSRRRPMTPPRVDRTHWRRPATMVLRVVRRWQTTERRTKTRGPRSSKMAWFYGQRTAEIMSAKDLKDKLENGADDLVLLVADNLGALAEKLDNVGDKSVDEADDDGDLRLDELDDVRLLLLDLAGGGVVNGLVDGTTVLPDLNVGILDLGVDDLGALVHLVGGIGDAGKLRENGNVGSGRGVLEGGKVVAVGNKTVNGVGGGRVGAGEEGGKGNKAEVKVLHCCGGVLKKN
ncbi:hypothetical protein CGRA01v4_12454 [Colletotrichum graminicola]|nr:hypothetical protein CGRA01v4_12454 [Colletotrichum graminicola]